MGKGFSHVGLGTHDMQETIRFYEGVLKFPRVSDQVAQVQEGGTMHLVYFDAGEGQFLVFMESSGIAHIPADFDTGINGGLGVPAGMYHFAFKVASVDELEQRRQSLTQADIEVTDIVDHGYAKAIFFRDPNDLQLEFYVQTRPFNTSDLNQAPTISVAR